MSNSESSQKLKIGDTVQLKSGGPTMTIYFIDKSGGSINCQWFAGINLINLKMAIFRLILCN